MITNADMDAAAARYGVSPDVFRALILSDTHNGDTSHLSLDNLDAAAHYYRVKLDEFGGDQLNAIAAYKGVASMTADKAAEALRGVSEYMTGSGKLPDKLQQIDTRADARGLGSRVRTGAFWGVTGVMILLTIFSVKNLVSNPSQVIEAIA